jgi:hypothetical protein
MTALSVIIRLAQDPAHYNQEARQFPHHITTIPASTPKGYAETEGFSAASKTDMLNPNPP